ncbi:hypothetical protein [Arthrobacter sp. W4I7]|uniref:hypothetical protein n=1 Tax=Arthrobacter sp. W4I7 TaxID=3042296 RepID=UPI0027817519|nr:hypothetical protein [Arthrobacter sp. W4I7]MDQ0691010.1 hypothetical protein [Arthrobacter sp. W4I7]
MFEQTRDKRFTFGSDAITNSYTKWGKPRALVEAKAELSEEQKAAISTRRKRSAVQ